MVFKESQRLLHRHLQHIVDALAPVLDLQRLAVVALALTHLTGDIDIRQKVHFDLDDAIAVTGLAPAALDIEGEPGRIVAPHLGIVGLGKHLPDVGEHTGVGGRVGTRGAADGRLIDVDDLVQFLHTQNVPVLAGAGFGAIELGCQRLV